MHVKLISYASTNEWLGFETLRRLSGKEYTPAHFFITDACGIYNNIHDVPIKELQDYDAFIYMGTSKAIDCYRGNWHERRVIPDSATAKFMMTMFNLLDKPSLSIVLGPDQYSYSINNKYRPNLNLVPFYDHKLLRFLLDEFKLKGYKNILVHSNIESDGTIDFSKDVKYLLNLFKEYEE